MFTSIQFIGTQRSGSNLLRLMLNKHPDISSHHPPHILDTFYPLLPNYGELTNKRNRLALVQDVCDWVLANPISWEPIDLNVAEIAENAHSLVEIFSTIYLNKAKIDGAKIWCCKSTFNIKYIDLLEEKLKPLYLYLYRDGRDVALSFKKAIVGPKHIYHIANKWQEEQRESLELQNRIPAERFVMVKYEELLLNTEGVLQNLCQKIGVPFDSQMLSYYDSEESKRTANSGEMWKNVARPIISNNFEKYKQGLTIEEIEIFETIAGDSLSKLGYSLNSQRKISFSNEDLALFRRLNEELRAEVISNSPKLDLEKRSQQDELLKAIKQRLQITH